MSVPIFAWNVPLVSLIVLKRSRVCPILLFSSISLHSSLRKWFWNHFIFFLQHLVLHWWWKCASTCTQSLNCVRLFVTLWTVAHQPCLFMGFPRQEYWSGWLLPSLGHLPKPGIKLVSPALAGRFVTTEPPGKPSVSMLLLLLLSCFSHVWLCATP